MVESKPNFKFIVNEEVEGAFSCECLHVSSCKKQAQGRQSGT